MLPERAFQPRGPYGMTLESFVVEAVEWVGETLSDAGSAIDDFVNEEIPGGWVTVGAAAAIAAAPQVLSTASFAPEATAAAGGGAAELASVGATGYGLSGPAVSMGGAAELASVGATTAAVPSAFETAVSTGLGQTPAIGGAGSVGTGGFGTALPPAAQVAGGLESAGFAAGTAANLAGTTAAGVGATGLLGGATAVPIIAGAGLSAADAIRAAQIANALTEKPQQQTATQPIGAQPTQAMGVDYSGLFGLLAQRAKGTGLLGTQFQPQPVNLLSLLG